MQSRLHRVGYIKPPYFMPKRKRRYYGNGRPRKRRRVFYGRTRTYSGRNRRTGGFTGMELKFYDTAALNQALDTNVGGEDGEHDESATIGPSTILQGSGEKQRIGRRATFVSWRVNGLIHCPIIINQTAAPEPTAIFVALIWDKQTNGALLNSEDVYINDTANTRTSTNLQRNLEHSRRFQVLRTWKTTIQTPNMSYDGTNIEVGGTQRHFDLNVRFRTPIIANYKSTAETIANSTDNSLHVLAWCSNTEQAPTLSYTSRLRFRG